MLVSPTAFEAVGNFTSHRVSCVHAANRPRIRKGRLLQAFPLERTLSMLAVASNEAGAAVPAFEAVRFRSGRAYHATGRVPSRCVSAVDPIGSGAPRS